MPSAYVGSQNACSGDLARQLFGGNHQARARDYLEIIRCSDPVAEAAPTAPIAPKNLGNCAGADSWDPWNRRRNGAIWSPDSPNSETAPY